MTNEEYKLYHDAIHAYLGKYEQFQKDKSSDKGILEALILGEEYRLHQLEVATVNVINTMGALIILRNIPETRDALKKLLHDILADEQSESANT